MGVQALGGALTLPGKAKFILTGLKPHAHDLISGLVDKGIGAKVNDVIALSANAAITTFEGGLASATAKLAAVRIPREAFCRIQTFLVEMGHGGPPAVWGHALLSFSEARDRGRRQSHSPDLTACAEAANQDRTRKVTQTLFRRLPTSRSQKPPTVVSASLQRGAAALQEPIEIRL